MIPFAQIVSSFNDTGTLLKQLLKLQELVEDDTLTGVTIVDQTATTCKLQFNFASGTTVTSDAINLKGATGDAATIAVGTTTTLAAGSNATVENVGTSGAAVLNFGIPQGATGATGAAGGITNINGYTGAITTSDGIAFINGTMSSYDFNLTDIGVFDFSSISDSRISYSGGVLSYALNTDKTIGKIYGCLYFGLGTIATNERITIDTGIVVSQPETTYTINTGCLRLPIAGAENLEAANTILTIGTDGHVNIAFDVTTSQSNKGYILQYPSSIYFFKDFGDTPNRAVIEFSRRMSTIERLGNER